MMRKPEGEPDAINLLNGFEKRWFFQRPELCRWSSRVGRQEQTIHGTARCFVGRLHAGDIRVRTDAEATKKFSNSTWASGRYCSEPAVLMSSGSALVAALGLGNSMSGSRNHVMRFESSMEVDPSTLRCCFNCVQTSSFISS